MIKIIVSHVVVVIDVFRVLDNHNKTVFIVVVPENYNILVVSVFDLVNLGLPFEIQQEVIVLNWTIVRQVDVAIKVSVTLTGCTNENIINRLVVTMGFEQHVFGMYSTIVLVWVVKLFDRTTIYDSINPILVLNVSINLF